MIGLLRLRDDEKLTDAFSAWAEKENPMTEVLRLIGLTQDGAMLPAILVGVVVWMTLTVPSDAR